MRGTGLQSLRADWSWPGPWLHCPGRPLRSPPQQQLGSSPPPKLGPVPCRQQPVSPRGWWHSVSPRRISRKHWPHCFRYTEYCSRKNIYYYHENIYCFYAPCLASLSAARSENVSSESEHYEQRVLCDCSLGSQKRFSRLNFKWRFDWGVSGCRGEKINKCEKSECCVSWPQPSPAGSKLSGEAWIQPWMGVTPFRPWLKSK